MGECTKDQQQTVFQYLWSKDVKISEIYGRKTLHYSDRCNSQNKVYEWVEKIQRWEEECCWYAEWAVIYCTSVEVKEQIDQCMWDKLMNQAPQLSISHEKKQSQNGLRPKTLYSDEIRTLRDQWILTALKKR
jgi:hypothetical protein